MTLTNDLPSEQVEVTVPGLVDEHDVISEFDNQTEEAAPSQLEEGFGVSLNETIEEEDVPGLEDIIFEFDHQIEEAAPSRLVEVFRLSLSDCETIEEEAPGLEDEQDDISDFDQQTEEATRSLSQLVEVFRVSLNETIEEDVLGLEDEPDEEAAPSQLERVARVDDFVHSLDEHNASFEEEVFSLEDEHDVTYVRGEMASSRIFRVYNLRDEHDVSFDSHHRIEQGDRSLIEAVRQVSFNGANTVSLRPASKLAVESLKRKIYKKTSDVVGEIDILCSICLEEFSDGRSILTLPCGHEFDEECVMKWFMSSHACPLCRFEMPCER